MKFANRISPQQQKFIRQYRDGKMTPEDLRDLLSNNAKQMRRWFENRFFWRNLVRAMVVRERQARVRLALERAAVDAALVKRVREGRGLTENARKTLELYVKLSAVKRPGRGGRRRKQPPIEEPRRDRVHPNFRHLETELRAELERGRGGEGC